MKAYPISRKTNDEFRHRILFAGMIGECGACHQWWYNPPIVNGKCTVCERTTDQIMKDHGYVFLFEDVNANTR